MAPQVALVVKNLHTNAGDTRDTSTTPDLGRTPREGEWQPTTVFLAWEILWRRSSGLAANGVTKGQT